MMGTAAAEDGKAGGGNGSGGGSRPA